VSGGLVRNGKLISRFTAPATFINNKPEFRSRVLSLGFRASQRPYQCFEFIAGLETQSTDTGDLLLEMFLKGTTTPWRVQWPQLPEVAKRNTLNTVPRTANNPFRAAGSTTINLINITSGKVIPAGHFFRFEGFDKVYLTTADRVGTGILTFYPELQTAIPLDTNVLFAGMETNVVTVVERIKGLTFIDGILAEVKELHLAEV